jgi:hypothetical protein
MNMQLVVLGLYVLLTEYYIRVKGNYLPKNKAENCTNDQRFHALDTGFPAKLQLTEHNNSLKKLN